MPLKKQWIISREVFREVRRKNTHFQGHFCFYQSDVEDLKESLNPNETDKRSTAERMTSSMPIGCSEILQGTGASFKF